MHAPFRVIAVLGQVHDDLAEAAADAALLNGDAEDVEVVAVGELCRLWNELG